MNLLCADEGQFCEFSGTQTVNYFGPNKKAYSRDATGSIYCDYHTFGGDPDYGNAKSCYVVSRMGDVNYPADSRYPGARFKICASEGGTCNVTAPTSVVYGVPGKWLLKDVDKTFNCNYKFMGGDPAYGKRKRCYIRVPPADPNMQAPLTPILPGQVETPSPLDMSFENTTTSFMSQTLMIILLIIIAVLVVIFRKKIVDVLPRAKKSSEHN